MYRIPVEVYVEYEIPVIRKVSIRCPRCNNLFIAREILSEDSPVKHLVHKSDVERAEFICPLCEQTTIIADGHEDVSAGKQDFKFYENDNPYNGALSKRIEWKPVE